jgi:hypothetical protein
MCKIEIEFDPAVVSCNGYTPENVEKTVSAAFSKKKISCISEISERNIAFTATGGEGDFAKMWVVLFSLIESGWFIKIARKCTWQDTSSFEDVLAQAIRTAKYAQS